MTDVGGEVQLSSRVFLLTSSCIWFRCTILELRKLPMQLDAPLGSEMSHSAVLFSISVDAPHHLALHEDIRKLTLQEPKGRNSLSILSGSSLNLRPFFVVVLKLDDTLCYPASLSKASLVKSEYSGYECKGNSSRCATTSTHCWDREPKSR